MKKPERKRVAERIQKRSDWYEGLCSDNQYTMQSHADRVKLLTTLAAAEREVEGLRKYATHGFMCNQQYSRTWWKAERKCTCGLDELLNQQEKDDDDT